MTKTGIRFCCLPTFWFVLGILLGGVVMEFDARGQCPGTVTRGNQDLFPIGFYELPEDDTALKAMADAGVNLVHCHSREDLDRVQAVGMLGVFPLSLQQGATDKLRAHVESVADHPALAVWEGPDEVVWNFTAYSGLHRKLGVHKTPGEWWRQTPEAVAYAEEQAEKIIPNMRAAVELIHSIDSHGRPIWINEALESDMRYVRQYLEFVDITGCDIYPIKKKERRVVRVGDATERWKQVGEGKPVWMVLQAFSWDELGDYYDVKDTAYPSFAESRFMAYDVIVHGARGILYWGSRFLKSDDFRLSIYALTSELDALQPFLTAPDVPDVQLSLVELTEDRAGDNVYVGVRKAVNDWLIILVNEDRNRHMGVVVDGLDELNGRQLHLLYDTGTETVARGELIVRMQPFDVRVYATDRQWESSQHKGRDYVQKTTPK